MVQLQFYCVKLLLCSRKLYILFGTKLLLLTLMSIWFGLLDIESEGFFFNMYA